MCTNLAFRIGAPLRQELGHRGTARTLQVFDLRRAQAKGQPLFVGWVQGTIWAAIFALWWFNIDLENHHV